MTKQDFVEKLRVALNGKVAANQIEEHVRYYEDYIQMEMRKGKSEEQVMQVLGDPRLIAKTIVETSTRTQSGDYREYENSYEEGEVRKEYEQPTSVRKLSKVPGWVWLILVVLIILVVLSVIFSVITALMPVLLPILLVVLLVKMFRNR